MQKGRAFWEQKVSEYHGKGSISESEFCQARHVKCATLDYWRRKLRDEEISASSPGFVRISSESSGTIAKGDHHQLRIRAGNTLILELPLSIDQQRLIEILQAVQAV